MRTWILAAAMTACIGGGIQAQEVKPATVKPARELKQRPTPQQRAELRAKELTLELDLTDKQQKETEKIMLVSETKKEAFLQQRQDARKNGTKLTPEQRNAFKSEILDAQISMKRDMKKVLTAEQYTKFEEKFEQKMGESREIGKGSDKRRFEREQK